MRAATRAGLVTSLAACLVITSAAAGPGAGVAAADEEPPFVIGARPVWFLLGGVTGGANVAADDRGSFVGGELSLVRLRDGRFFGLYADTTYDFGPGATYLTAGPELGVHVRSTRAVPLSFGADGGLVLRFDGDRRLGASGRVSVTLFGLFSIYGRYMFVAGSGDGEGEREHVIQAGAMLKFPLTAPFGAGAGG